MLLGDLTLFEYTIATLKNLLSHAQFLNQPILRSQVCVYVCMCLLVLSWHCMHCVDIVYHDNCVHCCGHEGKCYTYSLPYDIIVYLYQ